MRSICSISLLVAAVALLALSVPVHAAKMDSRIKSSAKQSYVFKTYLKGDDVKVQSKDGAVTLTDTVHPAYRLQQHSRGEAEKPQDQCYHRLRHQEMSIKRSEG